MSRESGGGSCIPLGAANPLIFAEQLRIIKHKNGPRIQWLFYLEGGCGKKGNSLEVVGSGDCGDVASMCPWASRLNVFVAPKFPGWEIKEAGGCGGLVFVEGVKSMEDEEGSIAVSEV